MGSADSSPYEPSLACLIGEYQRHVWHDLGSVSDCAAWPLCSKKVARLSLAEDAQPFTEGEVCSDDDRGALVELADEMEQPQGLRGGDCQGRCRFVMAGQNVQHNARRMDVVGQRLRYGLMSLKLDAGERRTRLRSSPGLLPLGQSGPVSNPIRPFVAAHSAAASELFHLTSTVCSSFFVFRFPNVTVH